MSEFRNLFLMNNADLRAMLLSLQESQQSLYIDGIICPYCKSNEEQPVAKNETDAELLMDSIIHVRLRQHPLTPQMA